ncbi:nicotinate phosphoribosyltransferase 1 [Cyclospora cayetanensis]|uniref:Nicotinate phosphoribosyltransferase n=1 Tax=Cyclospora cayetanensis TaxID=88456 RepID=A0A6P6RRC0_9EIME|nr:nicotinate phosphoribosyltransferase 1 [Cyclospora cayetanensis]
MPPAIREGSLVFPKVPVLQAAGPLGLCQMVETSILNILGYATLVATNAARHRLAAGWKKKLFEFGARRAQGPDGALTASRYAYLGGFDGTSNVQAAYRHEIPLAGTMAHAFVSSFASFESLKPATSLLGPSFPNAVLAARDSVFKLWHEKNFSQMAKEGELAAFTAYAMTFPDGFLALVDTYNTLSSGIPNFLAVALALFQEGHTPQGIRIDSGDLAYLSREARQQFKECEEAFNFPFSALHIVVSNDLNEAAISALNDEGHEADVFGIGTNVVTCQSQPALGMVYKLVELEGKPCMKLSEDVEKTSLPTAKAAYRLYNKAGIPAIDLIQSASMPPPVCGRQLFCKDLYDDKKRCFFIPKAVEELLVLLIKDGKLLQPLESIEVCRRRCITQLQHFRADHLRLHCPTEYKPTAYATAEVFPHCRHFPEWRKRENCAKQTRKCVHQTLTRNRGEEITYTSQATTNALPFKRIEGSAVACCCRSGETCEPPATRIPTTSERCAGNQTQKPGLAVPHRAMCAACECGQCMPHSRISSVRRGISKNAGTPYPRVRACRSECRNSATMTIGSLIRHAHRRR